MSHKAPNPEQQADAETIFTIWEIQAMTLTLTRTQLEASRTKLAGLGIVLAGDTGTVTHDGVTLSFAYSEPVLSVQTMHKPILMPEPVIEGKIRNWFAQS